MNYVTATRVKTAVGVWTNSKFGYLLDKAKVKRRIIYDIFT